MRAIGLASIGVALLFVLPTRAYANTAAICDANGTSAVVDGAIGASEYPGFSTGINSSFTGMIGAGVRLYADSDASGNIAFGLDATAHQCTWGADDSVVIYIDSTSGGFASTAGFTDNADGGRAAASGVGTGGGTSVLTFATSFFADYAIVLRNDSASLFQLNSGGAHTFVRALTRAPGNWNTNPCVREVGGITMSDLGSSATGSFDYVATLLNASNAFRSDEFQGSAPFTPVAGALPMTLPADGMNALATLSGITSLSPSGAFYEHFCAFRGAGYQSTPTASQLDSDLWIENTWSDGAMVHGTAYTTGDYARGDQPGGVTTGGSYSFFRGADRGMGVQSNTTELNPGFIELLLTNNQTVATTSVSLSYAIRVFNDQAWGSHLDLQSSVGAAAFTSVAGMAVDTGVAADPTPVWTTTIRSVVLPIAVPAGSTLRLHWTTQDIAGGSGSRDEFMIDDVVVTPVFPPVCGNSVVETGEACDGGASNGTATSCCDATCAYRPAMTSCGGGGLGVCDLVDTCNATGTCVDNVMASMASCRAARDVCDAQEFCDGTSHVCPTDLEVAAGTMCRANSGAACDVTDFCDGTSDACPQTYALSSVSCASANLPCDLGASCTGTGPACPANTPASPSTVCRAAIPGGCDVADTCNGALTCGADVVAGGGTVCRALADLCDAIEMCDGSSPSCPADLVAGAGVMCRGPSGVCDVAETCTGSSVSCPADGFAATGVCRNMMGVCDVPESCNGSGPNCPADGFATSGQCRAALGTCDVAESCDGSGAACPADGSATNGTSCDDGLACNGTSTCMSGTCTPGTPPSCADTNRCTTDACMDPSGSCSHMPIAGCCNSAMECDDTNLCTTDSCNGSAMCAHAPIANCCVTDTNCNDGNFCTTDTCPTPGGTCATSTISGCCHSAADCDDGLSCTTDTCGASHFCQHAAIPSCCVAASDCNDSNACTTDTCATGGACSNAPITGCCLTNADCADTNTCTTDTCDTTTHTCTNAAIANCCHSTAGCDDSDFCTDDTCNLSTERCAHAAHSCDDSDACTTDSCSAGACRNMSSCVDGGMDAAADLDAGLDAAVDDAATGLDAGVAIDAATLADTGVAVDAGDAGHDGGAARDGAVGSDAADAGPPAVTAGACACRVGAPARPTASMFLLGLALAAFVSRRRTRARR